MRSELPRPGDSVAVCARLITRFDDGARVRIDRAEGGSIYVTVAEDALIGQASVGALPARIGDVVQIAGVSDRFYVLLGADGDWAWLRRVGCVEGGSRFNCLLQQIRRV